MKLKLSIFKLNNIVKILLNRKIEKLKNKSDTLEELIEIEKIRIQDLKDSIKFSEDFITFTTKKISFITEEINILLESTKAIDKGDD